MPITGVAGDFVIDEPFFKYFSATLPVDVAAAACEEAGHGVTTEVVYPPFLSELAHQGVNPGKACLAPFPAIEPGFGFGTIDVVVAGYETIRWVNFGGQMPWDESAMAVSICLSEGIAESCLSPEIHIPAFRSQHRSFKARRQD